MSPLYRNVTTRTLSRDLNFLKQHELIIVEGNELRANLEFEKAALLRDRIIDLRRDMD